MTEKEVHLKLSNIKIDNDNIDYIKMTGEITGKLRDDLVKLFSLPVVVNSRISELEKENLLLQQMIVNRIDSEEL